MKLLYGVQATGNGHITRAGLMASALKNMGIDVQFLFSGREQNKLFDMDVFGDYWWRQGLTFSFEEGKVNNWKTVRSNNYRKFWRDVNELDLKEFDLVVSDFEPVTSWAARRQWRECIGISHQNAFSYKVPKAFMHWHSRLIMRAFSPVSQAIGLHWHHFNSPILPPVIDANNLNMRGLRDRVLVYLGFENLQDILLFLKDYVSVEFIVYANVDEPLHYDHIIVKPLSRVTFHQDLLSCGGVICNAGFELASEAIHCGKNLLVKPIEGQYEQLCNAIALEKLSLANVMYSLDEGELQDWLYAPAAARLQYPDVARVLADWLYKDRDRSIAQLSDELWGNIDMMPPNVQYLKYLSFSH